MLPDFQAHGRNPVDDVVERFLDGFVDGVLLVFYAYFQVVLKPDELLYHFLGRKCLVFFPTEFFFDQPEHFLPVPPHFLRQFLDPDPAEFAPVVRLEFVIYGCIHLDQTLQVPNFFLDLLVRKVARIQEGRQRVVVVGSDRGNAVVLFLEDVVHAHRFPDFQEVLVEVLLCVRR